MHNGYRLPESYIVDVLDHDINYDKKIRDKSKMRMLLRSLARVDAIVELRDGDFGAIEIKLGVGKIEEAVKSLNKFSNACDIKPKFLCVISGMIDYAYKRPDGIYVIPITALKP